MAKIGLKNFMFGVLTEAEDGTPTYAQAQNPGKAVSCNVSISNNSASLYADDGLAESDTSFQRGTCTMVVDRDDLDTQAVLLGHQITDGNMVRNANDVAPYVGLGRIVTRMINGVYSYKVEILYKVKFAEPSQENTTRGESLEFGTTSIEGTVSKLANGNWSEAKVFETMVEAQTFLKGLFGTATSQG